MKTRWLVLFLVCGCKEPTSLKGTDFEVPIPAGFTSKGPVEIPAGQYALWEKERPSEDGFLGSMVIVPIPATNPPLDPANEKDCKAAGDQMAQLAKGKLLSAAIIDGPFGKTCWAELEGAPTPRQQNASFTIVHGPKSNYGLTCNHAPNDAKAVAACKQVFQDWKFR